MDAVSSHNSAELKRLSARTYRGLNNLWQTFATVVLLIASLNLADMMMTKGTARRKEIAIRLAIGGGRGRIVRQLVTEGFLQRTVSSEDRRQRA